MWQWHHLKRVPLLGLLPSPSSPMPPHCTAPHHTDRHTRLGTISNTFGKTWSDYRCWPLVLKTSRNVLDYWYGIENSNSCYFIICEENLKFPRWNNTANFFLSLGDPLGFTGFCFLSTVSKSDFLFSPFDNIGVHIWGYSCHLISYSTSPLAFACLMYHVPCYDCLKSYDINCPLFPLWPCCFWVCVVTSWAFFFTHRRGTTESCWYDGVVSDS